MIRKGLQTDQNVSEHPWTTVRSQTYLPEVQDRSQRGQRPGNDADASGGRTHAHSIRIDARTTEKITEDVSITPKKQKLPNSPIGAKSQRIGEADGLGNRADGSMVCTDTQSVGTDAETETAKNASRNVRKRQRRPATQNSPLKVEIEAAKRPER